jgi:hypothetical protein
MPEQLELFDFQSITPSRKPTLKITLEALQQWKARIVDYQQNLAQPQQMSLFQEEAKPEIDPFSLKRYNSEFYQWDKDEGDNCLYFVVDGAAPLLLYVGETKQSPTQRWKGRHDARDYIENYIALHRRHKLDVAVATAFYWDVPWKKGALRELEQELIQRWRSPFNRESWKYWGKLF